MIIDTGCDGKFADDTVLCSTRREHVEKARGMKKSNGRARIGD